MNDPKPFHIMITMPEDYGCEISEASRDAYVARVERALAEVWPDASIRVDHGGFDTRVSGDADEAEVRDVIEVEWERFCADPGAWEEATP